MAYYLRTFGCEVVGCRKAASLKVYTSGHVFVGRFCHPHGLAALKRATRLEQGNSKGTRMRAKGAA